MKNGCFVLYVDFHKTKSASQDFYLYKARLLLFFQITLINTLTKELSSCTLANGPPDVPPDHTETIIGCHPCCVKVNVVF